MSSLRIGVDVGARAVKLVWMTSQRGRQIWRADSRPRRPTDGPEAIVPLLHQLLQPLARHRYEAPLTLAVSHSIVRQVTLQVATLSQIPDAVRAQLPALVPFEPSRLHVRYERIRHEPSPQGVLVQAQVAACDREVLQRDLDLFWRAGWSPASALPSAVALASLACSSGRLDEPLVLLDIGARSTIIAVVAEGRAVLARQAAMGSDYVTDALAAQLTGSCSWDDADWLKTQCGVPASGDASAAPASVISADTYYALTQPILEQWIGELKRTLAFCLHAYPDVSPARVVLSGGGSQWRGLAAWLSQQLGLPVERMAIEPLLGRDQPEYAVACGLVLATARAAHHKAPVFGRLDLLPEPARARRRIVRAARMALRGLGVIVVGLWIAIVMVQAQLRAVERQLRPIEQRRQDLAPITALAEQVGEADAVSNALVGEAPSIVEWLKQLADGFPDAVRLTELTVDGRLISLTGEAQAGAQSPEATIAALAIWLEQRQLCRAVTFGATPRQAQQTPLKRFDLTCQR